MKDNRYGRKFFDINKENRAVIDKYAYHREFVMNKANSTANNEKRTLMKLANFLRNIEFKDATKKNIQDFFAKDITVNSRDLYAGHIIVFYRWLLNLDELERPEVMKWFKFLTQDQKDRLKDPNAKEKYFITREEYDKLLDSSFEALGQEQALWECMFLSGGRPNEIVNMKLNDVKEDNGNITVTLKKSKTIPRNVPLPEPAHLLYRWVQNHPLRDKEENPALWLSLSRRDYMKPLVEHSLNAKLDKACKRADIKHLSPHMFRKTRATIYFMDAVTDEGKRFKKYDDKEIGMIFGWKPSTVIMRRREYDLTDYEDLREKIFAKSARVETIDEIKEDRDRLIKDKNEIEELKKQMEKQSKMIEMLKSSWHKQAKTPITNFVETPDGEKITFEEHNPEEYMSDDELLIKYIKHKKTMKDVKKLGLSEWAKRKRKEIKKKKPKQ